MPRLSDRLRRLLRQAFLCLFCAAAIGVIAPVHAANLFVYCDRTLDLDAEQKNQLLHFAAAVRAQLDQADASSAIISRSAIDLERFHIRYSHAGFALRTGGLGWTVRQLFYSCEDEKPDIFDQGLAGFLINNDSTTIPFVSLVFVPGVLGVEMHDAALDKTLALHLLGKQYSANAYAFSTQFQNCNQWLMEMLAFAWGHIDVDHAFRAAAQQWLRDSDYRPSDIHVQQRYLMWVSHAIPLIHNVDHPPANIAASLYQVSMPESIEDFIRRRDPRSRRVELCMHAGRIVIHQGWSPIADDCSPGPGDLSLSAG